VRVCGYLRTTALCRTGGFNPPSPTTHPINVPTQKYMHCGQKGPRGHQASREGLVFLGRAQTAAA
ncbi:hypothetical protein XENOCAPTIV_017863, partial [Xenoophorus captivus]